MKLDKGTWMHKAASIFNGLMIGLVIAVLALIWIDIYDAYHNPRYPIGAEMFWAYQSYTHKNVAAITDTLVFSCILGMLLYVRKFNPLLKTLFSLTMPLVFIVYVTFGVGRDACGQFLMNTLIAIGVING